MSAHVPARTGHAVVRSVVAASAVSTLVLTGCSATSGEAQQGDAAALPFSDAAFDVVTARHMLYHVPDVAAVLAEFRRVLKPGGRFLAVTNAEGYMAEL